MNSVMRGIYISFIFLFGFVQVFGQNSQPSITQYTKADGLPSNVVYDVLSDLDGILWIGTDAGLVRTDGFNFKVYTTKEGLPSNDVFKLFCDSRNRIWMETMSNEPAYIDNYAVHNKNNTPALNIIESIRNVYRFYEDEFHNFWIFASQPFVYCILPTGEILKKKLKNPPGSIAIFHGKIYLLSDWYRTQCSVRKGRIECIDFRNRAKATYYDDGTIAQDRIVVLENGKLKEIESDTLPQIVFIRAVQFIQFNRDKQITQIDSTGLKIYEKFDLKKPKYSLFSDVPLLHCTQDSRGQHWLTTNGRGLLKVNSFISQVIREPGWEQNVVMSVCITNNHLITGDMNGNVKLYDKNSFKLLDKLVLKGKFTRRIVNIKEFNSSLVVTSDFGMYLVDIISDRFKVNVHQRGDSKNSLQFGDTILVFTHSRLKLYDRRGDSISVLELGKRSYCGLAVADGILIGTEDGLLMANKKFTGIKEVKPRILSRIQDMCFVGDTLFLATSHSGIILIQNDRIIDTLDERDGMSNACCFRMQLKDSLLYIATQNGLNVYNQRSKKISSYFTNSGLASNVIHDITLDQSNLYAATDEGVSITPYGSLQMTTKLKLFVKPIIVEKDTFWHHDSKCNARTNQQIRVVLNTVFSNLKGKIIYRYKVNGSDFISTKEPTIPVKFSSPGLYRFEAYAIHETNCTSNIIQFNIQVIPYWWQTYYFKVLMLVLFVILVIITIYGTNRYTKKREAARHQLNNKLMFMEFSIWKSRINPHFVFNSLNSIYTLIRNKQNDLAEQFVFDFSKILRKTINNSDKIVNSIEEEVDYLRRYLSLEEIKKKRKLKYTIILPQELSKYYIPSMVLQPILENSIKYGVPVNGILELEICFERNEDRILVTLRDNGQGFNPNEINEDQNKPSFGIHSVSDKLKIVEYLLGKKIHFEIKYADEANLKGCLAIFDFPVIHDEIQNPNYSS